MTLDKVFRDGVDWLAAHTSTAEMPIDQAMASQPVQLLATLTDTAPEWIVQCVARQALHTVEG